MDKIPIPVESIVGAVIVVLAYIGWQVVKLVYPAKRKTEEKREEHLLGVISNNATVMEKLSQNVEKNTVATNASVEANKANKLRDDLFMQAMIQVMRESGRTPPSQPKSQP